MNIAEGKGTASVVGSAHFEGTMGLPPLVRLINGSDQKEPSSQDQRNNHNRIGEGFAMG